MARLMTIGEVADHFRVQYWRLARLYDRGILTATGSIGRSRVVDAAELPSIRAALEAAGHLKAAAPEA